MRQSSSTFTRSSYQLLSPSNVTIVHYLGDESCAVPLPHGNSRCRDERARPHVRTCPSVLESLKKECKMTTAAKAYRSQITKIPSHPSYRPVKQPRNEKQVKNARSQVLQNQRLSHDSLYNMHELALYLPNFFHLIQTYPDLVYVCGQTELLDELDKTLMVPSLSPQLMSYDTTFQLGDFYLSTLAFRHTIFHESPVIPACFLLHERKFLSSHEELFKVACKLVPSLSHTSCPIVTDEEQSFVSLLSQYMQSPHLRCWNHIFRSTMRWLRRHGAPTQDVAVYMSDTRHLLHLPSEEEYTSELDRLSSNWSAPFLDYYLSNIHGDIQCIARWAIEPLGVYDPFSSVTNNQAEGLNYVLKQLHDWREAPIDCMLLSLNHLQSFYAVEIARGKQGLGKYHLHQRFANMSTVQLPLLPVYSPEEIVDRVKGRILKSEDKLTLEQKTCSTGNAQLSQAQRANMVIEQRRISLDPVFHSFTVLGSTCPHVVTLFPKQSCSCPSTSVCYHIIAAQLSVGIRSEKEHRKTLNLSQLRKNARTRRDKRSGRKRPRPHDFDIVPAPDARGFSHLDITEESMEVAIIYFNNYIMCMDKYDYTVIIYVCLYYACNCYSLPQRATMTWKLALKSKPNQIQLFSSKMQIVSISMTHAWACDISPHMTVGELPGDDIVAVDSVFTLSKDGAQRILGNKWLDDKV